MRFLKAATSMLILGIICSVGYAQDKLKIVTPVDLQQTRNKAAGKQGMKSAYLTLWYDLQQIRDGEWFYDEVIVPTGESPLATYYSAIGGDGFYCGIQVNSKTERRVIFSVWDNNNGNNDPNKTAGTDRVNLLKIGDGVYHDRFGNEGSGIHTHWVYDWKNDNTYKFLVHVKPNGKSSTTVYSMYFMVIDKWKLMATISRPKNAGYLNGVYSFLEDFTGSDDLNRRAGYFQNQWLKRSNGEWVEISNAIFNLPFGDDGRAAKDYGCQLSQNEYGFLLVSGGGYGGYYIPNETKVTRSLIKKIPVVDLPK